jgi:hypothetical protein
MANFNKLSTSEKYKLIRNKGQYIASRYHGSFHIHLYKIEDLLTEVWTRVGLNQICWIEATDHKVLESYADHVKLNISF